MNLRRLTLLSLAVLSIGLPVVAARHTSAVIVADEPIPLCPPTAPSCPLGGPINQPPPPPTN